MPTSWRITKSARTGSAFDGEGARLYGGRWNTVGTPVVYTAQSAALATLELLVHVQATHLLPSYSLCPVSFDDAWVEVIHTSALPAAWKQYPAPSALQRIGTEWAAARRSVVLRVPSVIVPSEFNFILNPLHPDFGRLVIGPPTPFPIDPRLK